MSPRVIFFTFALLLSLTANAGERFLVLGDSLSAAYGIEQEQGWVAQLQKRLQKLDAEHQVINTAISGDTTAGGVSRIANTLAMHRPTWVLIELGGNDGLRGLSLTEMKNNLTNMTQQAQAFGAKVMIIGVSIPPNYGRRYIQRFENTFSDVAQTTQALLVPSLVAGLEKHLDWLQDDGIHPNAEGQALLLDNVWRVLAQHLDDH